MKKLLVTLLVLSVVLSGCSLLDNGKETIDDVESNLESGVESIEEEVSEEISEAGEEILEETGLWSETIKNKFAAFEANAYPELEVTGAILPRKAIISGNVIPVTVYIKNNGDKTIIYPIGSGGNVIPDALNVLVDKMQYMPPKEHLGPMTMDMQYGELKAGETLEYIVNILAVEETLDFQNNIFEYYQETGSYPESGDALEAFLDAYPKMIRTETGSYNAKIYFEYSVLEDGQEIINDNTKTSYNSYDFTIGVS